MLWYLPLPAYKERYTEYLSSPDGIFEHFVRKYDIACITIRPSSKIHTIKSGFVLDANVMCNWGFAQTSKVVSYIMDGTIQEGDTIYFEDFWHPGMELIPYALSLKGLMGKVKLCALLHAQSVDPYDFTAKMMMPWIRHFENAWGQCLDCIFVMSPDLASSVEAGIACQRVETIGMPFDSNLLWEQYNPTTATDIGSTRDRQVVYSSRFDEEKDPLFFLKVVDEVLKISDKIKFKILTGLAVLKGQREALELLADMYVTFPERIQVCTGLSKQEYYRYLATSAVQMNTANQDFVSWTLLEATTFGCVPFYPRNNSSFRDALGSSENLLYDKGEPIRNIAKKLVALVDYGHTLTVTRHKEFAFVYEKYNNSLCRMVNYLGFTDLPVYTLSQEINRTIYFSKAWDKYYNELRVSHGR